MLKKLYVIISKNRLKMDNIQIGERNAYEYAWSKNIHELIENINISNYSKPEQFAYWINHYNARTVELILENYPLFFAYLSEIKGISFFSFTYSDLLIS